MAIIIENRVIYFFTKDIYIYIITWEGKKKSNIQTVAIGRPSIGNGVVDTFVTPYNSQ